MKFGQREHRRQRMALGAVRMVLIAPTVLIMSGCGLAEEHTSMSERAAVDVAVSQCAASSVLRSGLARDVGMSDAVERFRRFRELEFAMLDASAKVRAAAREMPMGSSRVRVETVAGALMRFSESLASYLVSVPTATTATDSRTVAAFGELLEQDSGLTTACARIVDWHKPDAA